MAGPYFVDDSGDGSDGLTWLKAETSINDLDTAVTFASGEIVYFGADMQCQATNSASLTITGPASGAPVYLISSTVGSGTAVSYAESTTNQIDVSENAAYVLTFDGSFAIYGLSVKAGAGVTLQADGNETFLWWDGKIQVGANAGVGLGSASTASQQRIIIVNVDIDCAADGTTNRANAVVTTGGQTADIYGLTFSNAGYRTGAVFEIAANNCVALIDGCDFSAFDYATKGCEIFSNAASSGLTVISNCLTASTWLFKALTDTVSSGGIVWGSNIGPEDAPVSLYYHTCFGIALSSASIFRTSGATVEGISTGWHITTTATCSEGSPFYTPWIYGTVSSTGSKTFTVHTAHVNAGITTAALKDHEIWLEVEFLATADEAQWTRYTDWRNSDGAGNDGTITTTAADQTTDSTSTWEGLAEDFRQKLEVTATIGETGQFRARVAVGKASITSASYLYIDPAVFVDGVLAGSAGVLIPGVGIVEYSGGGLLTHPGMAGGCRG
jgi:hypothetical protein